MPNYGVYNGVNNRTHCPDTLSLCKVWLVRYISLRLTSLALDIVICKDVHTHMRTDISMCNVRFKILWYTKILSQDKYVKVHELNDYKFSNVCSKTMIH